MRVLLVDNHDSYTYNLVHLLARTLGEEPLVVTNDDPRWKCLDPADFDAAVISPGPGRPQRASDVGHTRRVLDEPHLPILGVCLGHQAIAHHAGAAVVSAPRPRHGHLSRVRHDNSALFAGIPQDFTAVRYHSLCVASPLPEDVEATAWAEDGVVMALRHRVLPRWGVQFHPESVASDHGPTLVANFVRLARAHRRVVAGRPGATAQQSGSPRPALHTTPVRPGQQGVPPTGAAPRALHEVRKTLRFRVMPRAVDTEAAFLTCYAGRDYAFWLDSSLTGGTARFSFLGGLDSPQSEVLTYRVGDGTVAVRSADGTTHTEPGTIFDALATRTASALNDREALLRGGENGPVIDLKQPSRSKLLEIVTTEDEDLRMPPKGKGLTKDEVALLQQWLSEGLPWEAGFTFQAPAYEPPLKPREVALPPAMEGRDHPVDRLVDAHFAKQGLQRPAAADDATFLRRAHLDLLGLLPTPEEVAAFHQDAAPGKRERLVRALLAREVDYAEHWLTFWNDLLRNDYGGTGFITGGRKQISKWLYESLVSNKPFDQFARELIAPPSDESRGFIDGIKWRGEVSAGQTVEIQFAQSVGQSFLGINLKCASCHDSFTDRWKLDEAYGLAAIYAEQPLQIHRCDKPVGRTATASWLFPELGQVNPAAPRAERLNQLATLLTHPENGRFSRTLVNRLWHRLMGHGIVHPLDAMQTEPWNADLLDWLAWDFQQNGYDLKKTLERIATSRIYQARSEAVADPQAPFVFRGPRARRLTAEQFVDAVWQLTETAPAKMDAPVFRGRLDPEAAKSVKLSGQWIWGTSAADGKTPPTGETILLRANWKLDAAPAGGAAILTCDNGFTLYINGRKVSEGDAWDRITAVPLHDKLQAGNNAIVVVARNAGNGPNAAGLYFQARVKLADGRESTLASGPDWQFSPSAPAGKEGRLGALPKNFQPVVGVKALAVWTRALQQQGPALLAQGSANANRRVRAALVKSDFLMRSLGRPNRDQIVSMRPEDLTTLEALDLSNGEPLTRALEQGAARLVQHSGSSSEALVRRLYAHTLARTPTASELSAALEVLGPQPAAAPVADLLWALLMQPDFLYVR